MGRGREEGIYAEVMVKLSEEMCVNIYYWKLYQVFQFLGIMSTYSSWVRKSETMIWLHWCHPVVYFTKAAWNESDEGDTKPNKIEWQFHL